VPFPELKAIDDAAWLRLAGEARVMQVDKGQVLFRHGDACHGYVLVIDGSIRVQKIDPQGHEIVLYRVEEGQTCMLTTSCLIGGLVYPAEGVAESDVHLAVLARPLFERALAESAPFRRFVLASMGRRIGDLMLLVEDVAFGRMDVRLARQLCRLMDGQQIVHCTHQELATELGTAREVVSRLLKNFEHRHWVVLRRGEIELLALSTLQQLRAEE